MHPDSLYMRLYQARFVSTHTIHVAIVLWDFSWDLTALLIFLSCLYTCAHALTAPVCVYSNEQWVFSFFFPLSVTPGGTPPQCCSILTAASGQGFLSLYPVLSEGHAMFPCSEMDDKEEKYSQAIRSFSFRKAFFFFFFWTPRNDRHWGQSLCPCTQYGRK